MLGTRTEIEQAKVDALTREFDERIERLKKEKNDENLLFKYKGTVIEYKRLSPITSEVILEHDGIVEILKTNVPALAWKKHEGKEIMISGRKASKEDEVSQIFNVRMTQFEQELHSFFTEEQEFENFANRLERLPDGKRKQLVEKYNRIKFMPDLAEEVQEQFLSMEELKLKYAILKKMYPLNIRQEIERDFAEYNHVGNSDKGVIRKVLSILINYDYYNPCDIPGKTLGEIEKQLDDHVGMNGVKAALKKEYRAFLWDKKHKTPKCILLVGPPGSGKTSLLQSFAKALDMSCETFNLAGMNDNVNLIGTSRVYDNSSPGDFLKRLIRVGNGMIILEKIDKLKNVDCINALTKMLSGAYQNEMLEVTMDVSHIWFGATATDTSEIPRDILDLVTVINVEDYTDNEIITVIKREIPKCCEKYGVETNNVTFDEEAMYEIGFRYSRKNSIRNIKDNLEDIFKNIIEAPYMPVRITKDNLKDYFSLMRNREKIRMTYAREFSAIKKKAIVCQDEYSEDVNRRIMKLIDDYEGSVGEEKSYILSALMQLVNTLPKRDIQVNLDKVEMELDASLYGLTEVKEKILDQVATYAINMDSGFVPILLNGGPGIGKTTIPEALARGLDLPLVEINMNEVSSGERITGTSHMVKGSGSGLFKDLAEEGVCSYDAIVFIDEFEKMPCSGRGNSHEAFYNLFDKKGKYYDNWLEAFYSTKRLLFILATNNKELIPPTILDRCIVIDLDGYSLKEKIHIAKEYVIPKLLTNHKCKDKIIFTENAVKLLVEKYAISEGVRDLEHNVESIVRRMMRKYLECIRNDKDFFICVDEDRVKECLGAPLSQMDNTCSESNNSCGTAHALAVAGNVGCVFQLECDFNPYGPELEITGLAKDSMMESVKLAMVVAAKMLKKEIPHIHFHMTYSGVEKSGPSAGITAWAAIMSLMIKKPLGRISMTGELTLSGQTRAVGGVKEKIIAAERAGIETVYIPMDNWRRLQANSELEKFDIQIVPVSTVYELAKYLFPNERFA